MKKLSLPRIAESLAIIGFGALLLLGGAAQAATINVDTAQPCGSLPCTSITGDLKAGCTFGEAITAINEQMDVGDCVNASSDDYGVNDAIHLPAAAILPFHDGYDDLSNGPTALPPITRSVAIRGHGATLMRPVEKRVPFFRFFEIVSNYWSSYSETFVVWDQTTFVNGNPGCDEECEEFYCRSCFSGGAGYLSGNGVIASFDQVIFQDNATDVGFSNDPQRGGAVAVEDGDFSLVEFTRSLFKDNKSTLAGALYGGAGSQMVLDGCTFSGNAAEEHVSYGGDDPETRPMIPLDTPGTRLGGAVLTEGDSLAVSDSAFFKNVSRIGGALAAQNGAVTVQNSSFFANHADLAGGSLAVPYNYRDYFDYNYKTYDVKRSEVAGFLKFATASLNEVAVPVSVAVHNATIVQNSAGNTTGESPFATGGGVANLGPGAISLKNTILSGNTLTSGGNGADCYGILVSLGNNNTGANADGACAFMPEAGAGADSSVDPGLKPCVEDVTTPGLASCDPLPTSPMIDFGEACPADDQHDVSRNPALCTTGAIEYVKSCEDGVTHAGETCDDGGVLQGISCGNGQVEEGEECDQGESLNSDTEPNACRGDCTNPVCGDGVVDDESEICDGGPLCGNDCQSLIVPSEECGITAEDLMDPSLKTNDDVVNRFGFAAVEKCLQVFGGGDSSCALNPAASGGGFLSLASLLLGLVPLVAWRANTRFAPTASFACKFRPSCRT